MKALIGRYFKTLKQAIKYYDKMDKRLQDRQNIFQVGNSFLIVGNEQLKEFTKIKK